MSASNLDPERLAQLLVQRGDYPDIDSALAAVLGRDGQFGGNGQPALDITRPEPRGAVQGVPASQRGSFAPSQRSAPPQRGQDQYGASPIANSNQPGVQSNGDDNPWLIGAFEGGTYDPSVMKMWAQRADAGDPKAAWVLTQVGFQPGMTLDQWASSRKLDVHADESGGAPSPWTHDPRNAPRQLGVNQGDSLYDLYNGSGYQDESDALKNYGWWNNQDPDAFVRGRMHKPDPGPGGDVPAPAPGATTAFADTANKGGTMYDQPDWRQALGLPPEADARPDPINQAKADKGPPPLTPSGLDPNYAAGKPDTVPDVPLESAPLKLDDQGRKLLGWYR